MNTTPVFRPGKRTSKNNYRPISIRPVFSKIFERLLNRQLLEFFDNILYKFQCGFRKDYETQQCLLLMFEIRKRATDNNKAFGLSFEGFSKPWYLPILGLGPLLLNTVMCDMFLILNTTYFTDFTDDSTPFVVRDNTADVIKILEEIRENLANWFSNNEMNLNNCKCHLLLNKQEPNTLKIGTLDINNSLSEKLLGITFGCELKFNKHIEDIFQKASQKLNVIKTCTIYGNNQKTCFYECVFQVTV